MPDDARSGSQRVNYAQLAEDARARADRARNRVEETERLKAVIVGLEVEQQDLRRQLAGARAAELSLRREAADLRQRLAAMMARGWWARLQNRR
jgi:hypothetical protein